jgi:hypothetical protein
MRVSRLQSPRSGARAAAVAVLAVLAFFAALAFGTLGAAPARATTVEPVSPAALAARSDLIARVVVRSAAPAWVGRRILTFYELEVLEAWRSADDEAPARVLLALPGGVVGALGQRVAGTPVLEEGARYVVCLGDDVGPRGARGIIGLWQGIWREGESGLVAFDHAGPVPPAASSPLSSVTSSLSALRDALGVAP